jgi:Na+-driven multidrug efflux pump
MSQGLSMALCVAYLKRHDFVFDFKPKSFRIVPGHLTKLIKIALPTTFESFSVELSFLLSTAIINSFGVMASAAAGSAVMLVNFGIMPASAMSGAISAMVSHNIGAKEYRRAAHTLYTGAAIAFGMCSVSFLLVRLFPYDLMSIFSTEPELISTGWQYLSPFSFDFFAVPFMFCMSGFFVGTGHTAFALFNDLLSSVFIRVPTAFLLGVVLKLGLGGVGLAAPLASAAGAVVGLIFFLSGRWKKPVVIREKQSAVPAD